MFDFKLHYVCPRCGRKLSKVDAYEHASIAVRRKCGGCGRRYALTVTPIAIKQGWAHSAHITELEQRVTIIEDGR
jgi:transcription elongation factor Elf1